MFSQTRSVQPWFLHLRSLNGVLSLASQIIAAIGSTAASAPTFEIFKGPSFFDFTENRFPIISLSTADVSCRTWTWKRRVGCHIPPYIPCPQSLCGSLPWSSRWPGKKIMPYVKQFHIQVKNLNSGQVLSRLSLLMPPEHGLTWFQYYSSQPRQPSRLKKSTIVGSLCDYYLGSWQMP